MSKRKTAVVICPGRGTYNQTELGYLATHHCRNAEISLFIKELDAARLAQNQTSISELDGADRFITRLHGNGENASALIYACALSDFKSINRDEYEIVAVTGNSMGWYLALACADVLRDSAGFELVNSMGTLMHRQGVGGQVIYPLVDEQWRADPQLAEICDQVVMDINASLGLCVYNSIHLGGMRVLAADKEGTAALLDQLPPQQDRFPFQLQQHSAFHSPVLEHIPELAQSAVSPDLFQKANLPLIDGRGKIWQSTATDLEALYDYTLGHQLTQTYDFSASLEVAVKEFAPDRLIILGPGTTLGPPVAQSLIQHNCRGLENKADFITLQKEQAYVLSMGIESQRSQVV